MKKIYLLLSIFSLSLLTTSCEKFLDIEPEGKIIPKTTEDYRKLLTSAYAGYPRHKSLTTVRTDEMSLKYDYDGAHLSYADHYMYNDNRLSKQALDFPYDAFYKVIFYSNQTIINGVQTMEAGDNKNQILAEAYGLRAMSFFDLANLYADVYDESKADSQTGIVVETEIQIETKKPKNSLRQVYNQIHEDLNQAIALATINSWEAGINYRFSKTALLALQARVYAYQKDYTNALQTVNKALELKASLADLNTSDQALTDFNSVESIMSLDEVLTTKINAVIKPSEELINAFETGDLRFNQTFVGSAGNYKVTKTGEGNNNSKVTFRTTELYFIKAEALAMLNNVDQAKSVISNVIDARYTAEKASEIKTRLANYNKESFIKFILDERFKEFAFEGQRWYDLRRLNQKQIIHEFESNDYILLQNDPRYTIKFPIKAQQNNPNL